MGGRRAEVVVEGEAGFKLSQVLQDARRDEREVKEMDCVIDRGRAIYLKGLPWKIPMFRGALPKGLLPTLLLLPVIKGFATIEAIMEECMGEFLGKS